MPNGSPRKAEAVNDERCTAPRFGDHDYSKPPHHSRDEPFDNNRWWYVSDGHFWHRFWLVVIGEVIGTGFGILIGHAIWAVGG